MENRLTPEAFEAEALPHLNDLFRSAARMTMNRGEAEDLVQEVYLQAWKSFHKYEPGTNCRAWLFKILFNKLEHHRRRQYTQGRWFAEAEEFVIESVASVPTVEQHLTDEEVLAALDRLPAQYREVILLADVEEFSYKEVSEVLQVPIGTVMSRLSRGRKQLRLMLAGVASSYGIGTAESAAARPEPSGPALSLVA